MIIFRILIVLLVLIPAAYIMLLAAGDISNDIRRQEKSKKEAVAKRLRVLK